MSLELGRLTDSRPPFKYSALTRVAFSDTDAQGVVYYGRYMPYFDLARIEYARHLGFAGLGIDGFEFAMRANAVEYFAPARFDDVLEIFARIARIGSTSMTFECHAVRLDDGVLMATAQQTLVLIDVETRDTEPVPASFRDRVRAFEGSDVVLAAPP